MRDFRLALLVYAAVFICAGLSYFFAMHTNGNNLVISSANQDWGDFGSYIGGILSPAASLLAGYLVYKSFSSNAYQQKLTLARESISRLDTGLEKKLEAPFNNSCFGEEYYGLPLTKVIYALSHKQLTPNEISNTALLALLHNIAILANSINHYIILLKGVPSSEKDNTWLGELERIYWLDKYSAICGRMVQVVGRETFERKVSKEQLTSFKLVLGGGYTDQWGQ